MALSRISSSRGQVLVVVALALVVLMGFVALAVDVGNAYGRRRTAQNAADAAALAGARQLSINPTDGPLAESKAKEFAVSNYVGLSPEDAFPVANTIAGTVKVEVKTHTDTFFARVVGVDQLPVYARAQARWFHGPEEAATGHDPVMPFTVKELPENPFEPGKNFNVWMGSGSGQFGWLSFNGCGSSCGSTGPLVQALTYPLTLPESGDSCSPCQDANQKKIYESVFNGQRHLYEGVHYCNPRQCIGSKSNRSTDNELNIGDWVLGNTGVSNSTYVRDALRNIILGVNPDRDPEDGNEWPIQNPVVIPVYDQATGSGSNVEYHIRGFARFEILCYNLSKGASSTLPCEEDSDVCKECRQEGKPNGQIVDCICGRFLEWVETPLSSDPTQPTYGENVIKLVQWED